MKKRRITFKFDAPDAKSVHLAGTLNDWNTSSHPLSQVKASKGNGIWKVNVYLEPGVYEYRFVVDGVWPEAPGSVKGRTNESGGLNSVIWVGPTKLVRDVKGVKSVNNLRTIE